MDTGVSDSLVSEREPDTTMVSSAVEVWATAAALKLAKRPNTATDKGEREREFFMTSFQSIGRH
jgi:hypothetical protein